MILASFLDQYYIPTRYANAFYIGSAMNIIPRIKPKKR